MTGERLEDLIASHGNLLRVVRSELRMLRDGLDAANNGKMHVLVDHADRAADALQKASDKVST